MSRSQYQPGQLRDFHTSRLTPNDRVFITMARSKILTQSLTVAGLTFGSMWLYRRIRSPKKGRIILPLFMSLCTAIPLGLYNVRNEYRRAIIELHDDSYLRKFLFDAAILANPDLNAQQIYSRIAIEENEKQNQQHMLEQQKIQSLHQQMTDREYQQMQQQQQMRQQFDYTYNDKLSQSNRSV